MTWLFVSTSPEEVSTMPVPAAAPFSYARFVLTTTTPVCTVAFDVRASAAWTPIAAAIAPESASPSASLPLICTGIPTGAERPLRVRPVAAVRGRGAAVAVAAVAARAVRSAVVAGLRRRGGRGGGGHRRLDRRRVAAHVPAAAVGRERRRLRRLDDGRPIAAALVLGGVDLARPIVLRRRPRRRAGGSGSMDDGDISSPHRRRDDERVTRPRWGRCVRHSVGGDDAAGHDSRRHRQSGDLRRAAAREQPWQQAAEGGSDRLQLEAQLRPRAEEQRLDGG